MNDSTTYYGHNTVQSLLSRTIKNLIKFLLDIKRNTTTQDQTEKENLV